MLFHLGLRENAADDYSGPVRGARPENDLLYARGAFRHSRGKQKSTRPRAGDVPHSVKEVRMSHSFVRGRGLFALALLTLAALALTLGPLGIPSAAAGKKKSYTKVTATAARPEAAGRQTVTVTMEIEKPWHAYANPVGNKDLAEAATLVSIKSKGGKLEDVKIQYPPGKEKKDSIIGSYRIYEDRVT